MRIGTSLFLVLALTACASAPPPPPVDAAPVVTAAPKPAAPEKEDVATGKGCAKATALCDNGSCDITVNNTCPEPVTCSVSVTAVCKSSNDLGEAKARGRDTIAAGTKGKISVNADCQGGNVMTSSVKEMQCH
jgi:hypothetical protein